VSNPKVWLGLFKLLLNAVFEFHEAAIAMGFIKRFIMQPFGYGLTLVAAFGASNVLFT
jgi:hypothetical protein